MGFSGNVLNSAHTVEKAPTVTNGFQGIKLLHLRGGGTRVILTDTLRYLTSVTEGGSVYQFNTSSASKPLQLDAL